MILLFTIYNPAWYKIWPTRLSKQNCGLLYVPRKILLFSSISSCVFFFLYWLSWQIFLAVDSKVCFDVEVALIVATILLVPTLFGVDGLPTVRCIKLQKKLYTIYKLYIKYIYDSNTKKKKSLWSRFSFYIFAVSQRS